MQRLKLEAYFFHLTISLQMQIKFKSSIKDLIIVFLVFLSFGAFLIEAEVETKRAQKSLYRSLSSPYLANLVSRYFCSSGSNFYI
jgi:hypothetical protein